MSQENITLQENCLNGAVGGGQASIFRIRLYPLPLLI